MRKHKQWTQLLGRFQPLHKGHIILIRTLLDKDKNVLVMMRKQDGTNKNPYNAKERHLMFLKEFDHEMKNGRMIVASVPDITEIVYGREPGYNIKQIKLDKEIENISATKIRKDNLPLDCQGVDVRSKKGKIS